MNHSEVEDILKGANSSPELPAKKNKKKKGKKCGHMKVLPSSNSSNAQLCKDVRILMHSVDDIQSNTSSDSSDDECTTKSKNIKTNKVIHKVPVIPDGDNTFKYVTILDSGTEWTVVGGSAWHVVQLY